MLFVFSSDFLQACTYTMPSTRNILYAYYDAITFIVQIFQAIHACNSTYTTKKLISTTNDPKFKNGWLIWRDILMKLHANLDLFHASIYTVHQYYVKFHTHYSRVFPNRYSSLSCFCFSRITDYRFMIGCVFQKNILPNTVGIILQCSTVGVSTLWFYATCGHRRDDCQIQYCRNTIYV